MFLRTKNNTCRDAINIKEELPSLKEELAEELNCLIQASFEDISSLKSKNSSYISSLKEETEYLREENREKKR